MKKFKFRLQRVLEYRERLKDDAKRVLLEATLALREARSRVQQTELSIAENEIPKAEIITSETLLMRFAYAARLMDDLQKYISEVEVSEKRTTKAMEGYMEASKEVRLLEALRERKQIAYKEEVSREETTELDEIAVQRVAHLRAIEARRQGAREKASPNERESE